MRLRKWIRIAVLSILASALLGSPAVLASGLGEVTAVYPERRTVVIDGEEYGVGVRTSISRQKERGAAPAYAEIPLTELRFGMRVQFTVGDHSARLPELEALVVPREQNLPVPAAGID